MFSTSLRLNPSSSCISQRIFSCLLTVINRLSVCIVCLLSVRLCRATLTANKHIHVISETVQYRNMLRLRFRTSTPTQNSRPATVKRPRRWPSLRMRCGSSGTTRCRSWPTSPRLGSSTRTSDGSSRSRRSGRNRPNSSCATLLTRLVIVIPTFLAVRMMNFAFACRIWLLISAYNFPMRNLAYTNFPQTGADRQFRKGRLLHGACPSIWQLENSKQICCCNYVIFRQKSSSYLFSPKKWKCI